MDIFSYSFNKKHAQEGNSCVHVKNRVLDNSRLQTNVLMCFSAQTLIFQFYWHLKNNSFCVFWLPLSCVDTSRRSYSNANRLKCFCYLGLYHMPPSALFFQTPFDKEISIVWALSVPLCYLLNWLEVNIHKIAFLTLVQIIFKNVSFLFFEDIW